MRRMWLAVVVALAQPALAEPAYWPLERMPAHEPSAAIAGFHSWRDACDEPAVPEATRGYVEAWCTFAAGDHRAAIKKLTRLAAPALRAAIDLDVAVMVADTFTGDEAARWYVDRYAPMAEIDLAIAAFASFGKRADAQALIAATTARIPHESKSEACKRIVRDATITTDSAIDYSRTVERSGCEEQLVPSGFPPVLDHWWDQIDLAKTYVHEDEQRHVITVKDKDMVRLLLEAARDQLGCNEQARVTVARMGSLLEQIDERWADLAATPSCRPPRSRFPITLER